MLRVVQDIKQSAIWDKSLQKIEDGGSTNFDRIVDICEKLHVETEELLGTREIFLKTLARSVEEYIIANTP